MSDIHFTLYFLQGSYMETVAILSGKGGAGKTTLAVHLAVTSVQSGHSTALIDLDPQASAFSWHQTRLNDVASPVVISAHAARLLEILDTAKKKGVALTIIDTAPHAETPALAAARAASLVLIPCRPSIYRGERQNIVQQSGKRPKQTS